MRDPDPAVRPRSRRQKIAEPQQPFLMKSSLSGDWFIVTKWVEKRGMCAIGADAGKTFDYRIAKEKFNCTEQMIQILKAERKRK